MGAYRVRLQTYREVKNLIHSSINLERLTREGDSPVSKMDQTSLINNPITTGHEESSGKQGGPSSKAKYFLVTDSEVVP